MKRKVIKRSSKGIRMNQIAVAQWVGDTNRLSYSLVGLGTDGIVYRYVVSSNGWQPCKMRLADVHSTYYTSDAGEDLIDEVVNGPADDLPF